MKPHDLEDKLSQLSLTEASDNYTHIGRQLLRHQNASPRNVWAARLNYALAASLLLSLGANMLQLMYSPSSQSALSTQCEVNASLPDNAWLHPQTPHSTLHSTPLQETRERIPLNTLQLC